MLRNFLSNFILSLLALSILGVISCQEDEIQQQKETYSVNGLDYSKLEFKQTTLKELLMDQPSIDLRHSALAKIDFGSSSNGKFYKSTTTDSTLVVDASNIYTATYSGRTFITFNIIEAPHPNIFRNLVIENISSDQPIAKIITYTPEASWHESNHDLAPFDGSISVTSLNESFVITNNDCGFAQLPLWGCAWDAASGHEPGFPGCNGGNRIVGYEVGEYQCEDFNGGEGSGAGSGDNSGDPTGGSSGTDSGSAGNDLPIDGVITKPNPISAEEVLESNLNALISGTNDSWNFDPNIISSTSLSFENVLDFDEWRTDTFEGGYNNSLPPSRTLDGRRWECHAIWTDLLTSIEADFVLNPNDLLTTRVNECEIIDNAISVSLSGLTFGLTLVRNGNAQVDVDSLPTNAVIEVPISIGYSVFLQGIGTLFTDKMKLVIMVNKENGTIYNIYLES
jgi:hypothetical protein